MGKYRAKKSVKVVGGQECHFDSLAEMRYAEYLERERKAKRIKSWWHHLESIVLYGYNSDLHRGGTFRVGTIDPDFAVESLRGVVERHEVKGLATPLWRWKRRMVEGQCPDRPYRVIDAGRGVCATGEGQPALFDERPRRKRRKR